MNADDAQITALALSAGTGDRVALAAFVRATQRDVYRFLTHIGERDEAEDLTQETYLRALRSLPSFAGRSSARTWLLSIARRVATDHVRRTVTRPRTTTVEDWDTAVAASPTHRRSGFDEGVVLRELVAGLQPDRRDAFILTQMLGLSYAAAAQVCECPIGTIRSRVARAREDLVLRDEHPRTVRPKRHRSLSQATRMALLNGAARGRRPRAGAPRHPGDRDRYALPKPSVRPAPRR